MRSGAGVLVPGAWPSASTASHSQPSTVATSGPTTSTATSRRDERGSGLAVKLRREASSSTTSGDRERGLLDVEPLEQVQQRGDGGEHGGQQPGPALPRRRARDSTTRTRPTAAAPVVAAAGNASGTSS